MAAIAAIFLNAAPTADLETLRAKARAYAQDARSENTRRAYESDLRQFRAWCARHRLCPLPAASETLALYLTAMAEQLKPATLERRLAAIASAHKNAGYDNPSAEATVRAVWRGVRRQRGRAQERKRALLVEELRAIIGRIDDRRLIGKRDRALLLLGFASALRRSELVALSLRDVQFERHGVILTIRRSKTNQEGRDEEVCILAGRDALTCPVHALRTWLRAGNIAAGPVFRHVDRHDVLRGERPLTPRIVAKVLKQYAALAGFEPGALGAHSLRSGFATSAALVGASERHIMRQTRHASLQIARRYIHQATRWAEHPQAALGL